MVHAVQADRHALPAQRAQVLGGEVAGLTEAGGDDEEGGADAALAQRRQGDPEVGGVAVVKGDGGLGKRSDRLQAGGEIGFGEPNVALGDAHRRGAADAVEGEVEDGR